MAYNLFVQLISKELKAGGLNSITSFVVMDVIFTVTRIINKAKKGKLNADSWYAMMIFFICTVNDDGIMVPSPVELFVVCVDILQTLCLAVLEGCPNELSHHLHTVVTSLVPFTKSSHTKHGQQVSIRKRKKI